ncbi:glycosyltransferase [Phormidium sp. FACHB-592]|uniref:Glycosyltransferase family 2 protein n=1 Tax=Stenomitos frigidus AS-A4 TaxID=2933935 RepID=A0ABV0KIU1_9CYAN|nr:glycosyltransferase family A protein [Phormidium sp. FACHB-592]MBD2078129.1 glycosyltransferase [Phormidium sp. FACHB-592]
MLDQSIALSIVIPCYNHGEYLLDALSSIQACLDPVYEVIIVNDGSNDPLTVNLLGYLKDQGYFVLDQNNQGLAHARNNGIAKASGRYILPLDADNKIRPDYILKGIEVLDQNPDIGVVYGKPEWFGEGERSWQLPEKFDVTQLVLGNYIDACAVYRKALWEDCGGYDPCMPIAGLEDWDLWLSAVERGWKFRYIPEVLYDYRVRANSMVTECATPENRSRLLKYICTKHASLYRTKFAQMISDRELRIGKLEEHSNNLLEQRNQLERTLEQTHAQLEQTHGQLEQTQAQLQQTHAQLEQTQTQLQQTHAQLEQTQTQLQQAYTPLKQTQTQLEQTQTQLEQTQTQLNPTRSQLQQAEVQLEQIYRQLQQTQAQLEQVEQRNIAMESSKFWKIRKVWVRCKQIVGLKA